MSDPLAQARYVSIETVRKNGTKATTPVWIAELGDKLVFTTNADTWKVRRIGNDPSVRLASCDARGNNAGEYHPGTARIDEGSRPPDARCNRSGGLSPTRSRC